MKSERRVRVRWAAVERASAGARRWASIALLASAAACSRSGEPSQTDGGARRASPPPPSAAPSGASGAEPSEASGAPAPVTPPATLTLLDPGRAPRRRLRYAWRAQQREELAMDLRTTAVTEEGDARAPGIPLPPVRIVIAIDPALVTPEGDLRYRWHVTGTDVGADAGTPSQLVDGMRTEVAAVTALAGTGVVSARGLAREITVDSAPPATGGATGQMVEQVRQTLRDVAAPFPEEEVGVGARWQKLSEVASKDARVDQTETFTLRDIQGTQGAVENVLAQTAPPQPLKAAGMPPGAQAEMESMLVSADARTRFDTSRLVPQTRLESTTTMVLSGHSPGDSTRRVGMVLHVEISISGSLR